MANRSEGSRTFLAIVLGGIVLALVIAAYFLYGNKGDTDVQVEPPTAEEPATPPVTEAEPDDATMPADEMPADEMPADEMPADEMAPDEMPADEMPDEAMPDEAPDAIMPGETPEEGVPEEPAPETPNP